MSWPCLLLAVDPAAVSGWCVAAPGTSAVAPCRYLASGVTKTASERRDVVTIAYAKAEADGLPLVIVGETWNPHGKWSNATKLGLGANWGRWLEQFDLAGITRKPLRLPVDTWRRALFGRSQMSTATAKQLATNRAKANLLHSGGRTAAQLQHLTDDEAEAVCLAEYAMRWPKVGKALGKRHLRKHGMGVPA